MEDKWIAILPYVSVKSLIHFAGFKLWSDTAKNWRRYAKCKRPSNLLSILKDKKGKKIQGMTIISSSTQTPARLDQLIASLFFLPSTANWFPIHAETFYYRVYYYSPESIKQEDSHTIIDKFMRSIVDNKTLRIYQRHDAEKFTFGLKSTEIQKYMRLKRMFNDTKKRNVIGSLPFYFRTQYSDPFLFPEIEDIQNYCTAFEILYKVDADYGTGETIANSLFKHFKFANDEEKKKLKVWFIEFYKVRSEYTHGKVIDRSQLVYKGQRHIDIAKQIYINAINKHIDPLSPKYKKMFANDEKVLIALFSSQEVYDQIVKSLTTATHKSQSGVKNLNHILSLSQDDLGKFTGLCYKFFLYVDKRVLKEEGNKRLCEAMQTLLSLLNYFVEVYNKEKYKKDYYIDVLQEIKKLTLFPKYDAELQAVYEIIKNPMIHYTDPIVDFENIQNNIIRKEVSLQDLLTISVVVQVFVALFEIYKGWNV